MGQFVRECEHLRGLAVGAIDKDQRSQIVGQGEPSELIRIELAPGVVADDATCHHEHTESVGLLNESPQRFGPSRKHTAFVEVETQRRSHALSSGFNLGCRSGRPDEGQRFFSLHAGEIPVPVLALLAKIDRVEEVHAGAADRPIANGAKVRDRDLFLQRLRKEKGTNRRSGDLGELFQLLERGLLVSTFPFSVRGKALHQCSRLDACPFPGPAQKLRFDVDTQDHRRFFQARKWRRTPFRRDS